MVNSMVCPVNTNALAHFYFKVGKAKYCTFYPRTVASCDWVSTVTKKHASARQVSAFLIKGTDT